MKRIKTAKTAMELLQNLRNKFKTSELYSDDRAMCGYWLLNAMIDRLIDNGSGRLKGTASTEWRRRYSALEERK